MFGLSPVKGSMLNEGSAYGDFYNAIDNFFNDDFFNRPSLLNKGFRMDVKENKDSYIIEAELPGVKRDEIEIGYNKDTLYIATHYKEDHMQKQAENQKACAEGTCDTDSMNSNKEGDVESNSTTEECTKVQASEKAEVTQEKQAVSANKVRYLHQERRNISMQRCIYLPEIKKEAIAAKLEDGILTVTVPKLKESESDFRIQIQ